MGTARVQKEYEAQRAQSDEATRARLRRLELERQLQAAEDRAAEVARDVARLQLELNEQRQANEIERQGAAQLKSDVQESRFIDALPTEPKA